MDHWLMVQSQNSSIFVRGWDVEVNQTLLFFVVYRRASLDKQNSLKPKCLGLRILLKKKTGLFELKSFFRLFRDKWCYEN